MFGSEEEHRRAVAFPASPAVGRGIRATCPAMALLTEPGCCLSLVLASLLAAVAALLQGLWLWLRLRHRRFVAAKTQGCIAAAVPSPLPLLSTGLYVNWGVMEQLWWCLKRRRFAWLCVSSLGFHGLCEPAQLGTRAVTLERSCLKMPWCRCRACHRSSHQGKITWLPLTLFMVTSAWSSSSLPPTCVPCSAVQILLMHLALPGHEAGHSWDLQPVPAARGWRGAARCPSARAGKQKAECHPALLALQVAC